MSGIRKTAGYIFLLLLLLIPLQAQNIKNNVYELNKGEKEIGVLAPFRLAITDSVEVSAHPLLFLLAPNIKMRLKNQSFRGFDWASEHGLFCPTILLRLLARKGTGGFISPEFAIPPMIAVYNGFVFSKKIGEQQRVSLSAGVSYALRAGSLNKRVSIDLPFIYPRLAVFFSNYQIRAALEYNGVFSQRWSMAFSVDGFSAEDFALENKAYIAWSSKGKTHVRAGYYLSYARYPFGVQAHLIVPVLDVVWRFK